MVNIESLSTWDLLSAGNLLCMQILDEAQNMHVRLQSEASRRKLVFPVFSRENVSFVDNKYLRSQNQQCKSLLTKLLADTCYDANVLRKCRHAITWPLPKVNNKNIVYHYHPKFNKNETFHSVIERWTEIWLDKLCFDYVIRVIVSLETRLPNISFISTRCRRTHRV